MRHGEVAAEHNGDVTDGQVFARDDPDAISGGALQLCSAEAGLWTLWLEGQPVYPGEGGRDTIFVARLQSLQPRRHVAEHRLQLIRLRLRRLRIARQHCFVAVALGRGLRQQAEEVVLVVAARRGGGGGGGHPLVASPAPPAAATAYPSPRAVAPRRHEGKKAPRGHRRRSRRAGPDHQFARLPPIGNEVGK